MGRASPDFPSLTGSEQSHQADTSAYPLLLAWETGPVGSLTVSLLTWPFAKTWLPSDCYPVTHTVLNT